MELASCVFEEARVSPQPRGVLCGGRELSDDRIREKNEGEKG